MSQTHRRASSLAAPDTDEVAARPGAHEPWSINRAHIAVAIFFGASVLFLLYAPYESLSGPDEIDLQLTTRGVRGAAAGGPPAEQPGEAASEEQAAKSDPVQTEPSELAEDEPPDLLGEDDASRARAAWEELWRDGLQQFPGRSWGREPRCRANAADIQQPQFRSDWVEESITRAFSGSMQLSGLEIGACQLPVKFPERVYMRYLDMFEDEAVLKSQCFLKEGTRKPDIIDDAQVLSKVMSESFNAVLAAHVLEHMPDVIGAIMHWLRILRDGGLAFIVVPDLCDPKNPFGERFRLVARPSHFVGEFLDKASIRSHFEAHAREHAVSTGSMQALRNLSGMPYRSWSFLAASMPELVSTSAMEMPLDVGPADIERWVPDLRAREHNVHLHLWNAQSFRDMLEAARPHIAAAGVSFEIVSIRSVGRTWLNMQELRVLLRRKK